MGGHFRSITTNCYVIVMFSKILVDTCFVKCIVHIIRYYITFNENKSTDYSRQYKYEIKNFTKSSVHRNIIQIFVSDSIDQRTIRRLDEAEGVVNAAPTRVVVWNT